MSPFNNASDTHRIDQIVLLEEVFVRLCIVMELCSLTHKQTRTRTHARTHTKKNLHTHTHTRAHTHTHTHTHSHGAQMDEWYIFSNQYKLTKTKTKKGL